MQTVPIIKSLNRSGTGTLTIGKVDNVINIKSSEPILCTFKDDDDSKLYIEGKSTIMFGNISAGNVSFQSIHGICSSGNISIINGQVFVDGKLQTNVKEEEPDTRYKKEWSFPDREILLKKITLSGTGDITIPANIISHNKMKLNQSGTLDLLLDCVTTDEKERSFQTIKIEKSGTGSTKCPLFRVVNIKINISGTSSLKGFFVEENLHVSASGCSKISVTKSSQCKLKKSVSGCAKVLVE